MTEFKNSFYNVAVEIAKKNSKIQTGQLALIDNFTMNTPMLSGVPFQKASHPYHHVYSRLLEADNLQAVDFDGRLPVLRTQMQLERVDLTAFGGGFEFGEDQMKQTFGTPELYVANQAPHVLRSTGMAFELGLYRDNLLVKTIEYNTARATTAGTTGNGSTMVAVTWEPGEMTGLYSPLPYGSGDSFGKLFEIDWANNKARHKLEDGIYGYAATIKIYMGILLANKQKIASLVNITSTPTPVQLAALVNAAQGSGSTRIYCHPALKTSIAAAYASQQQGNGLVSVTGAGEVSVLGVPIVASSNIPKEFPFMDVPVIGV